MHQILWEDASQPCGNDHVTKSQNRKLIRVTSSNERLKHKCVDNNNNNNQYIYKQRQSHAMSQRRWLATAVIFRPSDVSLGFAET